MADLPISDTVYDLVIVGGGINGCGIARDAAGRGLSVYLCEKDDLASGTSSRSTKLVHGGLRYLEHYEFRLVRESLREREVLWGIAPHIIRPLRFVLPYHRGLRPAWLLRLGLFIYDHLGGRKRLPRSRGLHLRRSAEGAPLKAGVFDKGFAYSDCWVDDARLVVLNARDAADKGAVIATRTSLVVASRQGELWHCFVQDERTGAPQNVRGRVLINAAGPWVGRVQVGGEHSLVRNAAHGVRLVQGSHIVVKKLFDHASAYIFQNADKRIVFAIPYEREFTLIGTTDGEFTGSQDSVCTTDAEIDYLCAAASEYFAKPVTRDDVVWTYSGVRSLADDGTASAQAVTRDYAIDVDAPDGQAALLTIRGGKITTYRRLAEHVLEKLEPFVSGPGLRDAGWTGKEPLPGGEFGVEDFGRLAAGLMRTYTFLSHPHAVRLARAYGLRAYDVLGEAKTAGDLGRDFGATLYEAEIGYLRREEWAETADDVLWRRSKLGLKMTDDERHEVEAFMDTGPMLPGSGRAEQAFNES